MRAMMLIGVVIVMLIVAVLVIKNTGMDSSDSASTRQPQKAMQHAEEAADQMNRKIDSLQERIKQSQ